MLPMLVDDLAVDDRVLHAAGRHHEPDPAAGKIVAHPLTLGGVDRVVVENRDVGGESGCKPSAIPDPEKCRWFGSQQLDRPRQSKDLPSTRPSTAKVGGITGDAA